MQSNNHEHGRPQKVVQYSLQSRLAADRTSSFIQSFRGASDQSSPLGSPPVRARRIATLFDTLTALPFRCSSTNDFFSFFMYERRSREAIRFEN